MPFPTCGYTIFVYHRPLSKEIRKKRVILIRRSVKCEIVFLVKTVKQISRGCPVLLLRRKHEFCVHFLSTCFLCSEIPSLNPKYQKKKAKTTGTAQKKHASKKLFISGLLVSCNLRF